MSAMCDPAVSGMDHMANFEFIKAFTCTFANPAGLLVVGLLVWAGISAAMYARQGSVVTPVILLLLIGGAIIPTIAAPGMTIAGILILVVPAGIVAYAIYRYSR